MRWIWADEKNRTNQIDHGMSFEAAKLVFHDPLSATKHDPHPDGDRWRTVGLIASVTIFVVPVWPDPNNGEVEAIGRIISARKATKHEGRACEEGNF